jgi:hypothetical protein
MLREIQQENTSSTRVRPPWLQTSCRKPRARTTPQSIQILGNSHIGSQASAHHQSCDAEFDGHWGPASINNGTLTWNEGEDVAITVLSANRFFMIYAGKKHVAHYSCDGNLCWDDGDVWSRLDKSSKVSQACSDSCHPRTSDRAANMEDQASAKAVPQDFDCRQRTQSAACLPAAATTAVGSTRARGRTVVVSTPMSAKQYRGTIKWFRGTYGWVECPEVAKMYSDCDIFLHLNDCGFKPRQWDWISFQLALDEKGDPKAVHAALQHE